MEENFKMMKKKTGYITLKLKWIPNSTCTFLDKCQLWKTLILSILRYGIITYNWMKKTAQNKWISLIRTSYRKSLGFNNSFPKEVFQVIFDEEE